MSPEDCEHERTSHEGNPQRCLDCGTEFFLCEGCSDPTSMAGVYHALPLCKPAKPDPQSLEPAVRFGRLYCERYCKRLEGQLAGAREESERRAGQRDSVLTALNAVYAERGQLAALLARMALKLGWRAGVRQDLADDVKPDWRTVLFVDLPTGQASWHFHDSERHLLAGLPDYADAWDGHSTDAKWERVRTALADV